MQIKSGKFTEIITLVISAGFIIWGISFIQNTSFIAIDGLRHYSLFDDAMISMRYAWNFSHGMGLVWNEGEYVQGYSNLFMTLLMSMATLLFDKSTAVHVVQLSGIAALLAIAFLIRQIFRLTLPRESQTNPALLEVLLFLGVLAYYPLAFWTLMGMETGLLTILLLLGVLCALRYTRNQNALELFWVSIFMGLAFWTRNDSAVFAGLIWAYVLLEALLQGNYKKNLIKLAAPIGVYGLFLIALLGFQHAYYGTWLSNTYTLKLVGMPMAQRFSNGIGYIKPFLNEYKWLLAVSVFGILIKFYKEKLLFIFLVFSAIGYQVYVGGDAFAHWRIMVPTIPFLILLYISSAAGMAEGLAGLGIHHKTGKVFSGILLLLLVTLGLMSVNAPYFSQMALIETPFQVNDNEANVNVGIALNEVLMEDASVGVFWAGAIPYYAGRTAIDFLGKSDRYIANLKPDLKRPRWNGIISVPGHNKYDLNYSIATLMPTYVQYFDWGKQDLWEWSKTRYVEVEYKGIKLSVRKASPAVRWDKVSLP